MSNFMKLNNHPFSENLIIPSTLSGNKKYYLYVHYRLDKNEPFYIGIGTKHRNKEYYRALCFKKRNPIWHRVARKTKYDIMIISESDNREEIIEQEKNYIKIFGKKKDNSGCLVNITNGGDGGNGNGNIWTQEMRDKIKIANSKRVISEETRAKLRAALKARGIINKKKNGQETK